MSGDTSRAVAAAAAAVASPLPSVQFLPLGAVLQSLAVNGKNIVQGFPTLADYAAHNAPHFGETIGRVANRISNARIDALNGKSYPLTANNGPCSLHGGPTGWGKREWAAEKVKKGGRDAVLFTYESQDGEEGFPGKVKASAWYTPYEETNGEGQTVTVLHIEYEAKLVGDDVEETAINMTNHSYFNLAQAPTIEGTDVVLSTADYLEVDQYGIPSGTVKQYPGLSPNTPFTLGASEPDIDDCFVFTSEEPSAVPMDTRGRPLRTLVQAYHSSSQVNLRVSATEPAFQFYTGKYINVPAVRGGEAPQRGPRSGFCVEPSRYVNAINEEKWRGMMVLRKGQTYGAAIEYRAWEGPKAF